MNREWMKQAACRGMNPGYFMPERGDIALVRAAKQICDTCPVKTECREYGLEEHRRTDLDGIFGGLTKHERLKILRTENLPQRRRRYNNLDEMFFRPCGTHAAYIRHLRRKEKPCDACRLEHARMAAERRAEVGRPSRARTNVA
jgi:hypothetical protein